jgi:simple sugar transport system permease protein
MHIELEKRARVSTLFSIVSPLLALALTLVFGVVMFWLLGKSPLGALYSFFIEPLLEVWSLHELAVKAAPLILIAVGLAICYRSNNWNIGAEGQFTIGAITGSILPVMNPEWHSPMILPLMLLMGMAGGALYAAIPALLKTRFNTNEILTSLMLVYIAQLYLDWLTRGPWRDPQGYNFPQTKSFQIEAVLPEVLSSGRAHWGFIFALVAAVALWFMMRFMLKGFQVSVLGQSERAGRFAGFSARRMVWFSMLLSGALAGLAGISEVSGSIGHLQPSISPGYGFTAIIVAFLGRLNPLGIVASGLVLALTYLGGEAAQLSIGISDKVSRVFQGLLLFFVLSCDTLIHYKIRLVVAFEAILLTVITASTPLVIAALGELVTERAGVLNLGVEGMMIMGAVCAFAATQMTGSPYIGILAGILGGGAFSLLFGFLTLTLVANQVATGLALTILGLGLSGQLGEAFVGQPGIKLQPIVFPLLSDIPFFGRVLFRQDLTFYLSVALVIGINWFLFKSRTGLKMRAIGDNHASAHALGINVIRTRYLAVMFGGACAGLAGAQLSLVYTPQWVENMSAGRGWIALALVVFASWRPWRVLAGGYLFGAVTIGQLHAQAFGIGIPSQFLSALPYAATIVVLIIISHNRRTTLINTPASLGKPFVPDR